ncbi:MAG: CHAT domain-containing protein, partial [Deltaproteobacteria bacterium]|nr:CHAT domain-containing protein [Deltaproteobacteria bacterium]
FLAAGASAVVGTRWPVRDSEAAAFVDDFYAALGEGRTVAGAVVAAEAQASSGRAAREAWVVVGDGGVVVVPGGVQRFPLAPIALGAACLSGLGALVYRWRVRGRGKG